VPPARRPRLPRPFAAVRSVHAGAAVVRDVNPALASTPC